MTEVLRRNDPPLAPHEDQDGWLYIRVKRHPQGWGPTVPDSALGLAIQSPQSIKFSYPSTSYVDSHAESRIISSSRVERAVEHDDIFRLCAEQRLIVTYDPRSPVWPWSINEEALSTKGRSLRDVYAEHCLRREEKARSARRNFR